MLFLEPLNNIVTHLLNMFLMQQVFPKMKLFI